MNDISTFGISRDGTSRQGQMKKIRKGVQRAMHCRCGRAKILAHGLCATCYTLKRQDEAYFGGLRETVLARDGYRCRVCGTPQRGKRSIIVHHREPGKSLLHLMISLCPGCHAKLHRTRRIMKAMDPLLLELWREQHPREQEQTFFDFDRRTQAAMPIPLPLNARFENREGS